jgi:two-component system CheB/CheR fusion protein
MVIGVVYQDQKGNIISANPAAEEILGLSLDQMQGRKSIDSRWKSVHADGSPFPGDEHPAMIALKTGEKVTDVIMGVHNPLKDDTTWINICAIPIFKENSKVPFQVYATFQDITVEKQTYKDLQNSELLFREIFHEINDGMALHEILLDDNNNAIDYRFLWANAAFEQHTGLKVSRIIGKTVMEIIPNLDKSWIERYGKVVSTGQVERFEQFSEELKKHFEVKAFRISNTKFAVIVHDITTYKTPENA